jgi:Flp pilus assembly protein TadB
MSGTRSGDDFKMRCAQARFKNTSGRFQQACPRKQAPETSGDVPEILLETCLLVEVMVVILLLLLLLLWMKLPLRLLLLLLMLLVLWLLLLMRLYDSLFPVVHALPKLCV